jgi:hypothetical protein
VQHPAVVRLEHEIPVNAIPAMLEQDEPWHRGRPLCFPLRERNERPAFPRGEGGPS